MRILNVICVIGILFVIHLSSADQKEPTKVETDVGTFNGYIRRFKAFDQELAVKRFFGIPFAEPPIGDLQFQKPVRKAKLDGPYDATEHRPTCIQQHVSLGGKRKPGRVESVKYSEDCLYLNIYTPEMAGTSTSDELFPVMIYTHGGAYVFGSPQLYPQDVLSAYGNVVAVTIAYRLSVWGFLSTGDEELPGNYGLWDQHMAIRWVHDNIAKFGGDPNSVTIYGSSAGGSSVVWQGVYPSNQGLIHKVVAQSGTITCGFAFNKDPLAAAKRIGSLVGCEGDKSTKQLAECLRSRSTDEIMNALTVHEAQFRAYTYQFVPVQDNDFIFDSPTNILHGESKTSLLHRNALNDLHLMIGVNSGEGLITFAPIYDVKHAEKFEITRDKFENELVPKVVKNLYGLTAPHVLNDLIVGEYTNWEDPDNPDKSRDAYVKLSSDYKYNIRAVETAEVHSSSSSKNTFLYMYDAFTSQHHFPVPDWATNPTHLDEMTSLLGYDVEDGYVTWTTPFTEGPPEKWELELSKAHIKMWTNFARTGNPNHPAEIQKFTNTAWPKYDTISEHYFRINRQMSAKSVGRRLLARENNFWRNVIPNVIDAVKRGQAERTNGDHGFCERETGCQP